MQKIKSINFDSFINILKSCLMGIVTTLIGIVILAFVLKFVDLSTTTIGYINNVIKGLSIFVTILSIKKHNPSKLILKSIVAGILYAVISFVVFSILNGEFQLGLSFVYDLLFSVIVAFVITIILNLLKKKSA